MPFPLDRQCLPLPADEAMAERNRERWRALETDDADAMAPLAARLAGDETARALQDALFGNSPFLSHCLLREPHVLAAFLDDGPDDTLRRLLADLDESGSRPDDTASLMRTLRTAKRRVALLVGLADIAGAWGLERVTGALSSLADRALSLGAAHLLRQAHERGDIALADPARPEDGSGLVVLGMGKLGARELNYSSDIDLVVFYDPDKAGYRGRRSVQEFFVALTRDLMRLIEDHTTDGYVFRTDLRLRPDPGSTPAAISLLAAETYYEGVGQNWERAAMIKARQVAGDRCAGEAFLKFLKPFIWRKHLDFAAIQDIHSIKRQINAHRGGGRIAVAGHNIKLGRGGIREIEFFAQTQQLIWGGREPRVRAAGTLEALARLVEAGHVDAGAANELERAYRFLRRVEHRLQMIDDQQTQTLPDDPGRLAALATFLGFADAASFAATLRDSLGAVEHHYAHLFEDAPPLAAGGNLVFTGGDDDPETLTTLAGMGFADPARVAHVIRGWHHGRVRATRSARAREMLTELTPSLLQALARGSEPDATFLRFATFLERLPAGVPLFALFMANPGLLDFLAEIMGAAPRLADVLASRPNLLDDVLSRDFLDPPPPVGTLLADLTEALDPGGDDEQELLDASRRWAAEQRFRVGVQLLRGIVGPDQAATHLSDIAEAALVAVQTFVQRAFERTHGRFAGPGAAIIAMGKMGSREMTATSDLDLILIYDAAPDQDQSDGPKPLPPSVYFARLTQRIINALTAKTAEGALYEVDMRLRPSGNAGPIAASLESFARYHEGMAWTWEHMALTRGRVVTGTPQLKAAVEDVIHRALTAPRDAGRLVADVADMRQRIWRHHGTDNPWEVKQRRGGLIDIEFIVQMIQLRWASVHPEVLAGPTRLALEREHRLGLLSDGDTATLAEALGVWTAIQQVLRQTVGGTFDEQAAPDPLRRLLARVAGQPTFATLKVLMEDRAGAVQALFERIVTEPARAYGASRPESQEQDP